MDTKLDFKIEKLVEEYEVIGSGPIVNTPRQVGDWWVTPIKDYKGKIPPEIQQNLDLFLQQRTDVLGVLVAEDMREVAVRQEEEKRKKEITATAMKWGLGILGGILLISLAGPLLLIGAAIAALIAYDPMVIVVLSDGRWICVASWYD